MNLHQLAVGATSAVNPQSKIVIFMSAGWQTASDGSRTPTYRPPVIRQGDIQPLSTGELAQVQALNLQGVHRAIYINGSVKGLVRVDERGGDLIVTSDGKVWLTTEVAEQWPNWVRVVVTLQNEKDFS
jgi:hypothetical protein